MEGSLVQQWAAEGQLPNLARLIPRGHWAEIANPPGFIASVSVWPSFFTASDPSVHGRYAYRQFVPGTYFTRVTSPEELLVRPFWEVLSEAGLRVAVIDMPSAPLAEELNGIQVAYWGPHDIEGEFQTFPAGLAQEFQARHGSDPVGPCDYAGHGPPDLRRFLDDLLARVATRLDFSCELLSGSDWDLFCTVFSEAHCVGHQAWHQHDPGHPRHDAVLLAEQGDPLLAVYRAIDGAIGELLELAGPDARIMLYSSQGMGPANSGEHLIDRILGARGCSDTVSGGGRLYSTLFRLRGRIPPFLHQPFGTLKNWLRNRLLAGDWAGRDCFPVPPSNGSASCLRLNIAGREPQGRLQPGPELEEFVTALERDLLALRDPESHRPLVRRVLRTGEYYRGEPCAGFPDLLVEWHKDAPIAAAEAPGIRRVEGTSPSNRSGDHTPRGFALVDIPTDGSPGEVSVYDLAPTLATWLGVVDGGFQGSPVREWL